jgi:hypothetical protein
MNCLEDWNPQFLITYFKLAHRPAHGRCDQCISQNLVYLKMTISTCVTSQNLNWSAYTIISWPNLTLPNPRISGSAVTPPPQKKERRGRKKTSHVRRDHIWNTRAFQNSTKLCGITWNARVLLHEMRVCSRRSLVRNFQNSFTANCTGSYESVQDSVKAILTNEKRGHTRIPCNATQFGGMRVCFNCDRSSSVESGH